MDARNLLETVLNEIKTQGGPELVLDQDGMAMLEHESGTEVLMTADLAAGVVRLNTFLGNIEEADRNDLLGDLLAINFLPQLYGPFFFALSPDQKTLLLVCRIEIEDIDERRLAESFVAIAFAHDRLKTMLASAMRGQQRVSEALEDLLGSASTQLTDYVPSPASFA
ncbi:MAG: type III secretion system chaperone [Pseudomonadota bacterium]